MPQRFLNFTSILLDELLDTIRIESFPDLAFKVDWVFDDFELLAKVEIGEQSATIRMHRLLNHEATPLEFFSLVFKHELLHIQLLHANEVTDRSHSDEFWKMERQIAPERKIAWSWLFHNFHRCVRPDRKCECMKVSKRWKREWQRPRIAIEDLRLCDELLPELFEV